MGYYDVAQICLNGHVINRTSQRNPEFNKKFCDQCGAETISACPECNAPLQGEYHVAGVADLSLHWPPADSFCHNCGKPYPWTQARLEAAEEFADILGDIPEKEREKLKQSLTDLVADTPRML